MIRIELNSDLETFEPSTRVSSKAVSKILKDAAKFEHREGTAYWSKGILNTFGADLAKTRFVSYLTYLNYAYQNHHEIVLAPQHIWYTALCEIATRIKASPKTFEDLFTTTPGEKQLIEVYGDWHGELPLDQITDGLRARVPLDIDLFLPEFSTHTAMSRLACQGAFADAMQVYYSYGMLLCGFPAVHIDGTEEDWKKVSSGVIELMMRLGPRDDELGEYLNGVAERAISILACVQDPEAEKSKEFLRNIYSDERCGSGGQIKLSGWFLALFMPGEFGNGDITNYPNHLSIVPYTQLEDGAKFELVLGLVDHRFEGNLLIPEYGRVQLRLYDTPVKTPYGGLGGYHRDMTAEDEIKQWTFHVDSEARREAGTLRVMPARVSATVAE